MKKIISVVLAVVMLCGMLAACGSKEADALVGTWKADVDAEIMAETMGADMAEFVLLDNVVFTMVMQFDSDGTFQVTLDEAAVDVALDKVLQAVKDGTYAMLEAQVAEMGLEMSVEEVLELSGMDLETMMVQLEEEMNLEQLARETISQATVEGNFEAKDGKLFMSAGLEYKPDPACYEVYTLEGDVLTLKEYVGDDESAFDGMYPLVFHKAA